MALCTFIASKAKQMLDQKPTETVPHAALMDETYRYQRLFYDVTRKYYLFGRDRLIASIAPQKGAHVLEVACGTGRNLQLVTRRYPECEIYGLDISAQMLISARAKLGEEANLRVADACDFDPGALFGQPKFDRIFISYGISMIPDWQGALRMAYSQLAPGGELHVVDFADQSGWPAWFARLLRRWLQKFHVTPRMELAAELKNIATDTGAEARHQLLYRGYAQYGVLRRTNA